jgi:glycerophosphoryl diester phosphodiesterase
MTPARSRPLLYAHRGAAAELPENTLPSFQRALERGADALEMDLHMTADGHIVVSHDPGAERMTGMRAMYREVMLRDIKSWDAGHGFVDGARGRPYAGKGYFVPTLEEILVELPGVSLNVDIKQSRPSMVEPLIALLRRTRSAERVTVASFQTRTMRAVRARGYEGATAMSMFEVISLLGLPGRAWRRLWDALGGVATAAQIPPRRGPIRMDTRETIERLHGLGMRVDFWTINDPGEAKRLLALGADGIMTDDPAALKPVFDHLDINPR